MKRREFIKKGIYAAGIAIVGGKVVSDSLNKAIDGYNQDRIYNELPKHVHDIKVSGKINNNYKERIGKGIVVDNKFLTCAHILDLGMEYIKTPFGLMNITLPVTDLEISVNGNTLEKTIYNVENDIAVCTNRNPLPNRKLPEDERFYMEEPNFPCEPSSKRKLGDEVYLIGNPNLKGTNIRKSRISDLNGFGEPLSKYCFGIDASVIPGDSGTPVVSKDFKLLGLLNLAFHSLGYVIKINEFLI